MLGFPYETHWDLMDILQGGNEAFENGETRVNCWVDLGA